MDAHHRRVDSNFWPNYFRYDERVCVCERAVWWPWNSIDRPFVIVWRLACVSVCVYRTTFHSSYARVYIMKIQLTNRRNLVVLSIPRSLSLFPCASTGTHSVPLDFNVSSISARVWCRVLSEYDTCIGMCERIRTGSDTLTLSIQHAIEATQVHRKTRSGTKTFRSFVEPINNSWLRVCTHLRQRKQGALSGENEKKAQFNVVNGSNQVGQTQWRWWKRQSEVYCWWILVQRVS